MSQSEMEFAEPDFASGYPIELEDREWLLESSSSAMLLRGADLPAKVDPRKSPLANIGWLQVEDQRSQGSCQGQALTECMEFCYPLATGNKVLQFSRQYAYIRSQMFDNIRGDSGSTLSGGTKAAVEGLPTEKTAPYMGSNYPGWGYITQAMKDEAKQFQLKSHTSIKSADDMRAYIGSGIGIVQIGISWNSSMSPDSNGCIRRWSSGGGGGHSVVFCGYIPDAEVGQESSKGWWGLLKNSWGTRWGKGGYAYVNPSVIDAMLRHQWTVFIGRSDMGTPEPRNIDWTKESILV